MADIISSDIDADKLDYLLRDAGAAGLPLRYDLERYLYTVGLAEDVIPDGDNYLQQLYTELKTPVKQKPPDVNCEYPYYVSYRLRLPRQAMNTVEQIIICKFMLFSYIYHHRKVRAAEGMLAQGLQRLVDLWRAGGKSDEDILEQFLLMADSSLEAKPFMGITDAPLQLYVSRICRRLLPREVYGFVSSKFNHPPLTDFISVLLDKNPDPKRDRRQEAIDKFNAVLGSELMKRKPELGKTATEALWAAGAWLDAPKPPKFENINFLIGSAKEAVTLAEVFPIQYWIQAYESHRYYVRVFAFSEYYDDVREAAKVACEECIGSTSEGLFQTAERKSPVAPA